MLYYDRVDFSEVTDGHKTSASNRWGICHYYYFFNCGFKTQTIYFDI